MDDPSHLEIAAIGINVVQRLHVYLALQGLRGDDSRAAQNLEGLAEGNKLGSSLLHSGENMMTTFLVLQLCGCLGKSATQQLVEVQHIGILLAFARVAADSHGCK